MPTLPWTTVNAPATPQVQCMASRLEVRSLRDAPGFLLASLRLWWQARSAPGVIGVALKAEMLKGTFWTYSAWTDKAAIGTYAGTDPHKSTVARKRKVMRESTFLFFTSSAEELPLPWDEIRKRIADERDAQKARPEA